MTELESLNDSTSTLLTLTLYMYYLHTYTFMLTSSIRMDTSDTPKSLLIDVYFAYS